MAAPVTPLRTVGDAARSLMRAADALEYDRIQLDRAVAALEARWAGNRAALPQHRRKRIRLP